MASIARLDCRLPACCVLSCGLHPDGCLDYVYRGGWRAEGRHGAALFPENIILRWGRNSDIVEK